MAQVVFKIEQEDGSPLEFRKTKIKARWVKEVFKMQKKLTKTEEKGDYDEMLDLMINFVVDFFNDPKLTSDAILDGVESDELVTSLKNVITSITGKSDEAELGE